METDGTSQKVAYKQQIVELTTMLDNSLKGLAQMKHREEHMDGQVQKLKHQLQEKDMRIKVLQGEVSRLSGAYQKLQSEIMQQQTNDLASTNKNLKLSSIRNSHLENQLQYYKSQNYGLVSINQEYLHQLQSLRILKDNQPQITAMYSQKIKQLRQQLIEANRVKPRPELGTETKNDLSLSQDQDNLLQSSKQYNQCDTKYKYNMKDDILKSQQQISRYRGMLEAQKEQHELSNQTLSGQIVFLRDENLNLREQLTIIRERNGLLEEKSLDLASEFETVNQENTNLSISQKELQYANRDLRCEIERLTSLQQLNKEQTRQTQQELLSSVASVDILQEKIQFLQNELKYSKKQHQNRQIQLEIQVEQLKVYEYQSQSMAIKYESLIQQKTKSYNTVKEQLIKLKQFLETTVAQDSERLVSLENENATLNDKIKSLQLQMLGNNQQDNFFNLTDRTPLAIVSQTNLSDLDTRLKDNELDLRVSELQQVVTQQELQINKLQGVVQRQKQQIIELSTLNKDLEKFNKMSIQIQQSAERQTMKINTQKYQQEIRILNQHLTYMDDKVRKTLKQIGKSLGCQLAQQQLEGQCSQVVAQACSKTKEWLDMDSKLTQCQLVSDQYLCRIQLLSQANRSLNNNISNVDRLTDQLLQKQSIILQIQHRLADSNIQKTQQLNSMMQERDKYINKCHQLQSAQGKLELTSKINDSNLNIAGSKDCVEEQLMDRDYNQILNQRDQLLIQIGQLQKILSTLRSDKDTQRQLVDSLNQQLSTAVMEYQLKLAQQVKSVKDQHQVLVLQYASMQIAHVQHVNHLQKCKSELQDNLECVQKEIERLWSEAHKQTGTESTIPDKEAEELRLKVSQLQQELHQATSTSQKHLSSIRIPNDQPRPKDKKLIEKMRIQILAIEKREQFMMDEKGKLRQDLFLVRRQLDNVSDDLAFQRKRNNNLEELYHKFRVSKIGLRQRASLRTDSSD